VLIAPILFLLFFAILQLFLLGVTCLALQRSAIAIARETSIADGIVSRSGMSLRHHIQKTSALLPLVQLDRGRGWHCMAASRVDIIHSDRTVTATIHYPMPIRLPGLGRWFGTQLTSTFPLSSEPLPSILEKTLRSLGIPLQGRSLPVPSHFHVRWMSFTATAFSESSVKHP
jgi:hypothetical protein